MQFFYAIWRNMFFLSFCAGVPLGVVKFDPATGQQFKGFVNTLSYTQYFANALIAEAERDDKIVAIHAAMGGGTGLNYFQKLFPERTFDVGIAEQHAVTFAAGLATEGMRPFCAIYSSFLQRGYDQVSDILASNPNMSDRLRRSDLLVRRNMYIALMFIAVEILNRSTISRFVTKRLVGSIQDPIMKHRIGFYHSSKFTLLLFHCLESSEAQAVWESIP